MPRKTVTRIESCSSPAVTPELQPGPDDGLLKRVGELDAAGLTPSSALDLIKLLIEEVPSAPKEDLERIKMIDKLINTARAMMETKLKTQEAAEIAARLDEIELRIEALATRGPAGPAEVQEVRNAG